MTDGTNGNDELDAFRKWVRSLSYDDLLRAMEFEFLTEEDSSSHEYELLKEMVDLQSPPPVPIHPRALSFRPATKFGVSDGRDEERRVRKNRFQRPRLFQLLERENEGHALEKTRCRPSRTKRQILSSRRFDVIAKRFVTPWGDILSVGCTAEQRDADDSLLRGTRVNFADANQPTKCAYCPLEQNVIRRPPSILRTLHVASRGKFLSRRLSHGNRSSSIPFCTAWLNPWFSLPMYLASRFEVALWTSYRGRQGDSIIWANAFEDAACQLSNDAFQAAVESAAIKVVLLDVLPRDSTELFVRDTIFWKLLHDNRVVETDSTLTNSPADLKQIVASLWSIPLIEMSSTMNMFHSSLHRRLRDSFALEIENALIQSLECEYMESGMPGTLRKGRGKGNKKKKKRKERTIQLATACVSTGSQVKESFQTEVSPTSCSDAVENTPIRMDTTEPEDRTRMVRALVDSIVDDIFANVDLDPALTVDRPPNVETFTSALGNKKGEQGVEIEHVEGTSHRLKIAETVAPFKANKEPIDEIAHHELKRSDDDAGFSFLETSAHCSSEPDPLVFNLSAPVGFAWTFDDTFHGWDGMKRYQSREKSMFVDFFLSQSRPDAHQDEQFVSSSTAASIASSSDNGHASDGDESNEVDETPDELTIPNDTSGEVECMGNVNPVEDEVSIIHEEIVESDKATDGDAIAVKSLHTVTTSDEGGTVFPNDLRQCVRSPSPLASQTPPSQISPILVSLADLQTIRARVASELTTSPKIKSAASATIADEEGKLRRQTARSPSPLAPQTPPPQLSPILVSLADLQTMRVRAASEIAPSPKAKSLSAFVAGSLPSSPIPPSSKTLTTSWSRDDLRIGSFTDDLHFRRKLRPTTRQPDAPHPSYRNVVTKSLAIPAPSTWCVPRSSYADVTAERKGHSETDLEPRSTRKDREFCARSETAIDVHMEEHQFHELPRMSPREVVDAGVRTSAGTAQKQSSQACREPETISTLLEERNAFRDMCLTLGAEVAKWKNLLAAQKGVAEQYSLEHPAFGKTSFDPEFIPPFFHGIPKATTIGAMSDAGMHRGDHDSAISEDGTDGAGGHDSASKPRAVDMIRLSTGANFIGSDVSIELNLNSPLGIGTGSFHPLTRDSCDFIPAHGLHSRLTKDMMNFLNSTNSQLRKQVNRKTRAIERMTRLVTALWPRAQVKLYGSHVTGLCLPSSDIDFVICLPAVHKNAPAVAPGVLEGRNAINESSQKFLARMLKGESWLDPRSIKIIERTIVPVIKVSTKDTRARMLQLDISFDAPEHHGLEAIDMVTQIMQELPIIQPLVLVLKQFLLDRGLLTAFTGGLSSYCLFLMVARYLQENPSSWGDCGSLLMGFLDFFGNSFDPRATGISVGRRQYFPRPYYTRYHLTGQQMWTAAHQSHFINNPTPSSGARPEFLRGNSFTEQENSDGKRSTLRPPRFQLHSSPANQRYIPPYEQQPMHGTHVPFDHSGRPYTFDPLFVEDPLSIGNNVGRNAFRIFQVQRAFSDAHRALVASLEWDIHSSHDLNDGTEYPLLNCLLQNEDMFYQLDDNR